MRLKRQFHVLFILVLCSMLTQIWFFHSALDVQSYRKMAQSSSIAVNDIPHSDHIRSPKLSPRYVYWCGYPEPLFTMDINIGETLFPEVKVSKLEASSSVSTDDILLYACGKCPIDILDFPGKVVVLNGESEKYKCISDDGENLFPVSKIDATDHPNAATYFASMYLQSLSVGVQNRIYKPDHRPTNTKERFLIYAASRCKSFRQEAFTRLASIGPVEYMGACKGGTTHDNITSASIADKNWSHNYEYFHIYRFALVMENRKKQGYITEKIVNAFLAGCVPIYYGTEEVFDVFNRNAFIFYNVTNPRPALERIAYLEKNRTAYDLMLKEEILANGSQTLEKYFSWSDEVGEGKLKWKIRQLLGYD